MSFPDPLDKTKQHSALVDDNNTALNDVNSKHPGSTLSADQEPWQDSILTVDPRRAHYMWHEDEARWLLVRYFGQTDDDSAVVIGHKSTGERLILSAPGMTDEIEYKFPTGLPSVNDTLKATAVDAVSTPKVVTLGWVT